MRISIITISFNSEKTIERTIKSVLAQTWKNYEYIIVDGASKDSTINIIKSYEPQFEGRLKWKSEPDTGIYNAMNKGIKRASGDIIGIVNSDDWLEQDALERVSKYYNEHNQDNNALYCGGINYHKTDGRVIEYKVKLNSFKWQARLFYVMYGIRHPATFVPRNVYERIGLFNEEMHLSADQDFILRCYFGGVKLINLGCVLSNMSEGGLSTEGTDRARRISEEDRRLMLKAFGKKGLVSVWLWLSWKWRYRLKRLIC